MTPHIILEKCKQKRDGKLLDCSMNQGWPISI